MEETKNSESKKDSHHGHHYGLVCCGSTGHKLVKVILIIVIAFSLLSIGVWLGARAGYYHGERGFYGCSKDNFRGSDREDGRQFRMMRRGDRFIDRTDSNINPNQVVSPGVPTGNPGGLPPVSTSTAPGQ